MHRVGTLPPHHPVDLIMAGQLDISPLVNALRRLEEGWTRFAADRSDTQIRDGLIQRFEFTYELSHKMLKRYLESVSATPDEFDSMSFQDLVRTGSEQGLLASDWSTWRGYRDMRAKTSHTYDENVAVAVVAGIPAFIEEARHLVAQLTQKLGAP